MEPRQPFYPPLRTLVAGAVYQLVAGSVGPWLPLVKILGRIPGNMARYVVDSLQRMCAIDIDLAGSPQREAS